MADFTPELKNILKKSGCKFRRSAKGSHEFWYSPITDRCFTVGHKIKSRHTANAVLKQAGIAKAF